MSDRLTQAEIDELEIELTIPPEGTWEAEIIGVSSIDRTKKEDIYYLWIGVRYQSWELRAMVAGYRPPLEFIKRAEPWYTGKKVLITIKHRFYNGAVYSSAQIVWDGFEEMNDIE